MPLKINKKLSKKFNSRISGSSGSGKSGRKFPGIFRAVPEIRVPIPDKNNKLRSGKRDTLFRHIFIFYNPWVKGEKST